MREIIETINKLQMVAFALNEQFPNSLQALENAITVIQCLDWDIGALRVENATLRTKMEEAIRVCRVHSHSGINVGAHSLALKLLKILETER